MRIVLRQLKTGHYLDATGTWSLDVTTARQFESTVQALSYCRHHRVGDARILLKFSDAAYDIDLALPLYRPGSPRALARV